MSLIKSHRFKPGDLSHWEKLVQYDRVLARSAALARKEERAITALQTLPLRGYVGVSWGKDSVVVAHLCVQAGVNLPLVWVRVRDWENPDCVLVRDAFLQRFPTVEYHEVTVSSAAPRRWEREQGTKRTSSDGFKVAAKRFGEFHVSGVRGEESTVRGIAVNRYGVVSAGSARPIGRWSAVDVFAYLQKYELPVHPAYACSFGGVLDRRRIRVGTLGGSRGSGVGRVEWEEAYYGDVVQRSSEEGSPCKPAMGLRRKSSDEKTH